MTREALQLYLRKLAPGGSIAFHISNRYLNLEPVLVEIARDARIAGDRRRRHDRHAERRRMAFKMDSKWVVLSRKATGPRAARAAAGLARARADVGRRPLDRRLLERAQRVSLAREALGPRGAIGDAAPVRREARARAEPAAPASPTTVTQSSE